MHASARRGMHDTPMPRDIFPAKAIGQWLFGLHAVSKFAYRVEDAIAHGAARLACSLRRHSPSFSMRLQVIRHEARGRGVGGYGPARKQRKERQAGDVQQSDTEK